MGSLIEINDTLQISTKQGFPRRLNYIKHKIKPFVAIDFKNEIFEFKDKPKIRLYQSPLIRNFLVHNINDKWRYWGLVYIIKITHNNIKQTTSRKFKNLYLYSRRNAVCS